MHECFSVQIHGERYGARAETISETEEVDKYHSKYLRLSAVKINYSNNVIRVSNNVCSQFYKDTAWAVGPI